MHLADAVHRGSVEEVKSLLNLGADPNTGVDNDNYGSLLMEAITKRHNEICYELISHGAELNHRDRNLRSAIAIAAVTENMEIFKFLLNQGLRLHTTDFDLLTTIPRDRIIRITTIYYEQTGNKTPYLPSEEQVELYNSCESGDIVKTISILDKHPDLANQQLLDQKTPLIIAIKHHHVKLIEALIQFGVCPNTTDIRGVPPITNAIMQNQMDTIKKLIPAGANLNKKTYMLATPLHYASREKMHNLTKLLLRHNANPNTFDLFNKSPLIISIENNDLESVKLLIKNGARPMLKNYAGKCAPDFASDKTDPRIIYLVNGT